MHRSGITYPSFVVLHGRTDPEEVDAENRESDDGHHHEYYGEHTGDGVQAGKVTAALLLDHGRRDGHPPHTHI